MKYDKKLKNTWIDNRGETSIRELLFLSSKAKLILTTEGLLTHVSAAFNTPCVTILPGFMEETHSAYPNVEMVKPDQSLDCLHCWKTHCPHEKIKCLESIKPQMVIDAVNKVLKN